MNRVWWFFSEVLIGLLAAGAMTAIVTPLLTRAGRDPGPAAMWLTLAVAIVLCIVLGERLRRRRHRHRLP
jgi:hypothetical protein